MRAVVQRVKSARCTVNGAVTGEIGVGLLVFVGVGVEDTERDVAKCAEKLAGLRIFEDDAGKMSRSAADVGGGLLVSCGGWRCLWKAVSLAPICRSTPATTDRSRSFSIPRSYETGHRQPHRVPQRLLFPNPLPTVLPGRKISRLSRAGRPRGRRRLYRHAGRLLLHRAPARERQDCGRRAPPSAPAISLRAATARTGCARCLPTTTSSLPPKPS